MKLLYHVMFAGFLTVVALISAHGTALADSCKITAPVTLGNLLANYDPTAASNSYAIPANALQFQCTITSSATKARIYFLGTSSTEGTYAPPVLTGPNGSQLAFQICTTSATCSSGFWNNANYILSGATFSSGANTFAISTSLAVYVAPGQNDYVGSYGPINLYFSFTCGKGSTFTPC